MGANSRLRISKLPLGSVLRRRPRSCGAWRSGYSPSCTLPQASPRGWSRTTYFKVFSTHRGYLVHICGGVCAHVCTCIQVSSEVIRSPGPLQWLWATQLECWNPNFSPLREHLASAFFLSLSLSFFLAFFFLWLWLFFSSSSSHFFFLFFSLEAGSLCSLGYLGTLDVDKADLELTHICLTLPPKSWD